MKLSNEEILVAFCLLNIPDIITQEEFDDVKKAIKELLKENKELSHIIAKATDKLYCWGEVLDADFQKEMLKILDNKGDK